MSIDIPYGVYDVEIGESFLHSIQGRKSDASSSASNGNFHTLKYDFKPKSVASEQETYISVAENRDVQVMIPNENLDHMIVYKGSMKPIKGDKECILIFDHDSNKFRLDRFSSNISVKKTRDNNVEDEDVIKKIQRMRMSRKANEMAMSPSSVSSSSSSSSDSDSTSSSSSEDENDESADKSMEHTKNDYHESDDEEHVKAIEELMSASTQQASSHTIKTNNDTSIVHNDLYMSDDNPTDSDEE